MKIYGSGAYPVVKSSSIARSEEKVEVRSLAQQGEVITLLASDDETNLFTSGVEP